MLLKICDILNTFCQAFLFIWVYNNIVPKANRITRIKSCILTVLIFSDVFLLTTYSSINPPLANFLSLIIVLLLLILFSKKVIINAFVGFFLAYFLITITSYFTVTIYQYYLSKLYLNIPSDFRVFIFVYIPVFLYYILFYKLRIYIFDVGMFIKSLKHSIIIIQVITFALIFINTLYMDLVTENMNLMFKVILYIAAFITFIFTAIYFAKINDKSKELEILNEALNSKIIELKKIKHDYGSEISSIYGLYQLGKMDRLGELLKSIVERNQSFTSAVNIDVQANPLVASVLNSAVAAGINVINIDSGDYENLAMTDNELLKLISNIIKNSVDALVNTNNPVIKYTSYSNSNRITIIISNNGPEIPQEIITKIFEAGFSTKEKNNEDRGYGLSIVKDIINKCNGKISIKSNKGITQFILEIPYKPSSKRKLAKDFNTAEMNFEETN